MSSSISELRREVWRANRGLADADLVVLAFGNASGVDRSAGVMAIKPSGVDCRSVEAAELVVVDLASGQVVEGDLRPSSDASTHLELYRSFRSIGGVVHTHSPHATAWAQAQRPIPCLGTTHADYLRGPVPVTRHLSDDEIAGDYERNTGMVIIERYGLGDVNAEEMPAVLIAGHGAFAWGRTPSAAVEMAIALEQLARIATYQVALGSLPEIPTALIDRHFSRKHGPHAYYGQRVGATLDAGDGHEK